MTEIFSRFQLKDRVTAAKPFGNGHINDTFLAITDEGKPKYILQRINRFVFTNPDAVMENIVGVTQYLRGIITADNGDPDRETLTMVPTVDGEWLFWDLEGSPWRCMVFIENMVAHELANPQILEAAGRRFGEFLRRLDHYPADSLHETIVRFHDTPSRLSTLKHVVRQDPCGRAKDCRPEIEFALSREADCSVLVNLMHNGGLPLRVTHNDCKLNNVLLDLDQDRGCVIDLDTVMPGLSAYDFGEAIRTGASTGFEDETDLDKVHLNLDLVRAYATGYLAEAGAVLTNNEKNHLAWGARLMTLENGIRFLTDYLGGDTYYHTTREHHNLDRCRTQLRLVAEMEEEFHAIEQIIKEISE